MPNLNISIIIPCYNEEEVILKAYDRVKNVVEKNKYNYEIMFINDGSIDNTLNILEKIAKSNKNVKIISFSRNFGHQAAVTAGIKNCSADIAIIIDADLQDPPELFPEMIKIYQQEKCNVVYGVRKTRKKENFLKKITAKIYYRFINYLSDVDLPFDTGDFRLIDKKVIESFKNFSEKNKYIRGLMSWVGFKQLPVYYNRDPRFSGKTKYSIPKMLKLATTGIFYFTKRPLKMSLSMGFISIIISLVLIIYVFVSKFSNKIESIPGWASTTITIIFFGGVQLFMIGILGEYIGSIFDEVKNRPEYIIDKKTNLDNISSNKKKKMK
ncbi:MAG: glycosyltransferase family 2 protein [Spirochaetes bacterium]|nr:glycosyltransferase family 2 protein [Spirochaetota bacterium]